MRFRDRAEAGEALGRLVENLELDRPIVLGIPRGGVPVAVEVARRLGAPLGIVSVRKLGVPGQPELAFGAIAERGAKVVNEHVVSVARVSSNEMEDVEGRERAEMERRLSAYVDPEERLSAYGRAVVLVDDGLATGATMRAAVESVRTQEPSHIVVAVPVASPRAVDELAPLVDRVVAVQAPVDFVAVGQFYVDFRPTRDDEVRAIIETHRERQLDADD